MERKRRLAESHTASKWWGKWRLRWLIMFLPIKLSSASTVPDSCSAHPCPGPVFQDTGLGIKYLGN